MTKENILNKVNVLFIITLIAAVIESVLLIPVIGGSIIILTGYLPLLALLGLYIAGLVIVEQVSGNDNKYQDIFANAKVKYIIGIVASVIAFIPFIGWIIHIAMAIIMWIQVVAWSTTQNKVSNDKVVVDVKESDVKSHDNDK